jgi:hypothetical protein
MKSLIIKYSLILLILLIIFGCSTKQKHNNTLESFKIQTIKSKVNNVVYSSLISDSIVFINFGRDIMFHWNNNTSTFVQDSIFENNKIQINVKKEYLVSLILDTTLTQAYICCDDTFLRMGDLAFLLLDEIYCLSYPIYLNYTNSGYNIIKYSLDCPYPKNLVKSISQKRTIVYKKLEKNIQLIDSKWIKNKSIVKTVKATMISDSIILVDFGNKITFHWNNKTSLIVYDLLFQKNVQNFQKNKEYLLSVFLDTTITPATIFVYDKPLKIGDLAFLLIDAICDLSVGQLSGYQMDCINGDCLQPYGLIESISANRKLFYKKMKNFDPILNKFSINSIKTHPKL